MPSPLPPIPGTTPFDGDQARKGYALNKMCFSFNDEANRKAFVADEEAYMKQYGLNEQQAGLHGQLQRAGGGHNATARLDEQRVTHDGAQLV